MMTTAQVVEKIPAVRQAIACMLKTLCSTPHAQGDLDNTHAVWIALTEPGIPLFDYALRLQTYMHCSPSCVVSSIIYIDRLIQLGGSIAIHKRTIHRLMLTAMVIAAKYWDDEFYKNSYYARVGGLPVVELNKLEADLCFELNFELSVDPRLFAQYYEELAKHSLLNKCPNCNPEISVLPQPDMVDAQSAGEDEQHQVEGGEELSDQMADFGVEDSEMDTKEDCNSLLKVPQQDPHTKLNVLCLTPSQAPSAKVPTLRGSFCGSVSSRISMEENQRQDMEAYKRHSSSFHKSFNSNNMDLSKRAPPQLMAAAQELVLGWNEDDEATN